MQRALRHYDRITGVFAGRFFESAALLLTRLALAGVFWRSGRTKVVDGRWLEISDSTRFLFEYEYTALPLPVEWSVYLATYAEHVFPILLVAGFATRFSALSLLLMTLVIQFFVYPDAWWPAHSLWAAMSMILLSRGAGGTSIDAVVRQKVRRA